MNLSAKSTWRMGITTHYRSKPDSPPSLIILENLDWTDADRRADMEISQGLAKRGVRGVSVRAVSQTDNSLSVISKSEYK